MATSGFFAEARQASIVKSHIVTEYFRTWSKVMLGAQKNYPGMSSGRIAYIDLFAGPGVYEDGTESTPMRILRAALDDDRLRTRLVTVFNEGDSALADQLRENIATIEGIDQLTYPPRVECSDVNDEMAEHHVKLNKVPSFCFVDPFGYKGVSTRLLGGLVKDFGCDLLLFFNYRRVNMGLRNDRVASHIDKIFGSERADEMRKAVADLDPNGREELVLSAFAETLLEDTESRFVLPFCFRPRPGARTTHYLVFASKRFLGYDIMKSIMSSASSEHDHQDVGSFDFFPATLHGFLREMTSSADDLPDRLTRELAGRTLTRDELYEEHSPGTPFRKLHYNDALKQLENDGRIECTTSRPRRRRGTYASHVSIFFPELDD